jgi:hypothetical protein
MGQAKHQPDEGRKDEGQEDAATEDALRALGYIE